MTSRELWKQAMGLVQERERAELGDELPTFDEIDAYVSGAMENDAPAKERIQRFMFAYDWIREFVVQLSKLDVTLDQIEAGDVDAAQIEAGWQKIRERLGL